MTDRQTYQREFTTVYTLLKSLLAKHRTSTDGAGAFYALNDIEVGAMAHELLDALQSIAAARKET